MSFTTASQWRITRRSASRFKGDFPVSQKAELSAKLTGEAACKEMVRMESALPKNAKKGLSLVVPKNHFETTPSYRAMMKTVKFL